VAGHSDPAEIGGIAVDNTNKTAELREIACKMRVELLRMFSYGKAHHFGGSLSCVEIVAALYFYKMNFSAGLLKSPKRDRFIMSKGHSVPAQYVALAMHGIFPMEELKTIKHPGARLQGHPDMVKTPGIEAPTGSLGQGLSFANGLALGGRLDGLKYNLYIVLGDGELQEGQVWEAAMTTAHYKLGNVCVFIDRNGYQSQGCIDEMMGVEPLEERFRSFGWETARVDGHDLVELCTVLDRFDGEGEKPLAIVADTVKGKGIDFMENTYRYHNFAITEAEYKQAMQKFQAEVKQ
jgi:transketolase